MSDWSRILQLIRPLQPLLTDPTVTEVMVNRGGRVVSALARSGLGSRDGNEAVRVGPLAELFLELLALVHDDLPVIGQADL